MTSHSLLSFGDVLHIPETGPNYDRSRGHFHVGVLPPDELNRILLVPICGSHSKCDMTCLLGPSDYHILIKASFVMYAKMNFYSYTHLLGQIQLGKVEKLAKLDEDLASRVRTGVVTSKFSARLPESGPLLHGRNHLCQYPFHTLDTGCRCALPTTMIDCLQRGDARPAPRPWRLQSPGSRPLR